MFCDVCITIRSYTRSHIIIRICRVHLKWWSELEGVIIHFLTNTFYRTLGSQFAYSVVNTECLTPSQTLTFFHNFTIIKIFQGILLQHTFVFCKMSYHQGKFWNWVVIRWTTPVCTISNLLNFDVSRSVLSGYGWWLFIKIHKWFRNKNFALSYSLGSVAGSFISNQLISISWYHWKKFLGMGILHPLF